MALQWRDVFSYRSYSLDRASRTIEPTGLPCWGGILVVAIALSGCKGGRDDAGAQTRPGGRERPPQVAAVDVAIAATAPLQPSREYTGTTQPVREVAIRAQAEGQVQSLNVDVGDRVQKGQVLARIDDTLLGAATAEAAAELGSRQAEIGQLQSQVSDAIIQVEQSRLQLQQAEFDAQRYETLAKAGAGSKQQAQQARTQARTAAQVLRSAQAKVRDRQQAIAVANRRIAAQQAVVAQQQRRRAFALVTAPLNGLVLNRSTERGNVIQVGNELLRLGDFSQAKVAVQISELDLAKVRVGGAATVKLDAFPNQTFRGTVSRISPAANPTSRLVPVEVTLPNPSGRVGGGLLARASFTAPTVDRVTIPQSALQSDRTNQPQSTSASTPANSNKGKVFVVVRQGDRSTVAARTVTLGDRSDGKVEILAGLNPGERFVARASKPLKEGEEVRLSILSAK
jgi:HlyD family secretion protein